MAAETTRVSGEDRLSALPDDALNHVLSFLPSDDAVRTSVLARRWRHLWRSTRALRVAARRDPRRRGPWTPRSLNSFVNTFLLVRGGAPLDEFEVRCGEISGGEHDGQSGSGGEDYYPDPDRVRRRRDAELSRLAAPWILHAVSFCQARALRLSVHYFRRRLQVADAPFASPLLTTVQIDRASLTFRSLDFSRCPAMEELELTCCKLHIDRIVSPSLRRLAILECDFDGETRTRISTPQVISLQLSVNSGRSPVLEKMPLLVAASARFVDDLHLCHDICGRKRKSSIGDCGYGKCKGCYGSSCNGSSSVVLEGLSNAAELELASDPSVFIFRRDFKFGTIFSKLKTLVLNEWCMKPDSGALDYFLRNSPILEKLTIQIEDCCRMIEKDVFIADQKYTPPTEHFSVPKQLRTFKIKWHKKNKMVEKIVRILIKTYGVPPEQISIEKFDPPEMYRSEEEDADSDDDYW